MSPGSFESLSSLDRNLSKKGIEAESLVQTPEYCFVALRGFIGYVLQFLEKKHSVPPPQASDLKNLGQDEFRINRLSKWGVQLTELELSALHNIRFYGNKGSHVAGNERFFTARNVDKAMNSARHICDWLYDQYVRRTEVREEETTQSSFEWQSTLRRSDSAASATNLSFWFDDVDIGVPQLAEPAAAVFSETLGRKPSNRSEGSVIRTLLIVGGIAILLTVLSFLQNH